MVAWEKLKTWKGMIQGQFTVFVFVSLYRFWSGTDPTYPLAFATLAYILYVWSCIRSQEGEHPLLYTRMVLHVAGIVVAFLAAYALYYDQMERVKALGVAALIGFGVARVSTIIDNIFAEAAKKAVGQLIMENRRKASWVTEPMKKNEPVKWSEDEDFE
jgi:hypothetical protein